MVALSAQMARVERALEKQARLADKRRKKDEARRQQEARAAARAARRQEERRAQAAARAARQADRVDCCDGTKSPSCRYSQGSLRGCCSHHGGVC
ncbi:MAG: hypothetical protein AAGF11_15560 [Myxococcota bacterium]